MRSFLRRGDAYCQAMPQSTSFPYLIGTHPLTVELVVDALDGDLHVCYLGVVKGLSVASEGLLCGDIHEEHQDALHVAGGHL